MLRNIQTRQYCVNIVMFNALCCNPSSDCVTVTAKTGCNQQEFVLPNYYLNLDNPSLSILDLNIDNNVESGFLHLGVYGNGICNEIVSLSGSTLNIEMINEPPRTNQLYEIVFKNNEVWNNIAAGSVLKLSEANIKNNDTKPQEPHQNDKSFLEYQLINNQDFRIRKVLNNGRKINHNRLWEDMRLHLGHIRISIKTSDGLVIESFDLQKDELYSTNYNLDLKKFDDGFKFNSSVLSFLRTCSHDSMKSKGDVDNLSSNNVFEVFPNPAFKEYTVRYTSASTGLFTLDNYSALGELVKTTTWYGSMLGELRLDANETNSGLQILVLRFPDGQTTTQKLIIIE